MFPRAVLTAAVFAIVLWLGRSGFDTGDEGNVLELGHRMMSGQVPYRDFTSVYPPLGYAPVALAMSLAGVSVWAVRWVVAATHALVAWLLCGLGAPRAGAWPAAALVAAGTASALPNVTAASPHDFAMVLMALVALRAAGAGPDDLRGRAMTGALAGLAVFVRQNSGVFALLLLLQAEAARARERTQARVVLVAGFAVQLLAMRSHLATAAAALLLVPHLWLVWVVSRTSPAGAGGPPLSARLGATLAGFAHVVACGLLILCALAGPAAVLEGFVTLPLRHLAYAYWPLPVGAAGFPAEASAVAVHGALHALVLQLALWAIPASIVLSARRVAPELAWLNVWSAAMVFPRADMQHVVRALVTALPVLGLCALAGEPSSARRRGVTAAALAWCAWFALPVLADSVLDVRASLARGRPVAQGAVTIPGCGVDTLLPPDGPQARLYAGLMEWRQGPGSGPLTAFCGDPGLHVALRSPARTREHYFVVPWFSEADQERMIHELEALEPDVVIARAPPDSFLAWTCPRVEKHLASRYRLERTVGDGWRIMR
jgi:hypothetical protein